jgi:spore coat polysaccharide biosynthesis protein SpsF
MLTFRKADMMDMLLYFEWANDDEVRKQSYQTDAIDLEHHKEWFNKKINDANCLMLLFENEDKLPVGQVRFQKEDEELYVIGISLAKEFRGKGLATKLLQTASDHFLQLNPGKTIYAYIKEDNEGSIRSFIKAGFVFARSVIIAGKESVLYLKTKTDADS